VIDIVRRLKDFARYEEGDLEDVVIHEELKDTLMLAHHELKHGIQVETEFAPLPTVQGHANQLNQVFLNIIVNAKHAMAGAGRLRIRTEPSEIGVRISFEDTGPGIPEDKIATIFEPGFTTKSKGHGLGLGLAICQQIVDKHHGAIWAENLPSGGARFVLDLPVAQPDEAATDATAPATEGA